MNYAFKHDDKGFLPDGSTPIPAEQVEDHNQRMERIQLEALKTGPPRLFLYVKHDKGLEKRQDWNPCQITTWPGTRVDKHAWMGPRRYVGFGYHTYRRALKCQIEGFNYHGWYMESSGNYCRLTRSKGSNKGRKR